MNASKNLLPPMPTQLLINNIEQQQPQHRNDTVIKLFGRSPENPEDVVPVTVRGFGPYFYGRESEVRRKEDFLLEQEAIREIEYDIEIDGLKDESLARVRTRKPQHVSEMKQLLDDTWAADVPFTNRFRIDTGLRAYAQVPDPDENGEVECTWDEVEPVVAPE